MVDDIADELKRGIPRLENVTIHYEPVRNDLHRRVILFDADKATLASAYGRANWLRLDEIEGKGTIKSQQWFKNPYHEDEHGKAMKLTAWMVKNRVDEVCFNPAGSPEPLMELLSTLGVQVSQTAQGLQ